MSIKSNFPAISPSLLLDFSNTKKLDLRITFTRSSTAIYFDNNGVLQTALSGIPRFDHNPITGESLGLLIEEQRTNLLTYSEQFDNAAWTKSEVVITANAVASPAGTITADKFVPSVNVAAHYIQNTIAPTTAQFTGSVYVKLDGSSINKVTLYFGGASTFANFDLSTVTASWEANIVTASITMVGNGWYRLTTTCLASVAVDRLRIYASSGSIGASATAGNGTSGIYIWGAQLEAGAFATSYIPTVASQVTRSTDAANMTGTNFSSWFNSNEGTVKISATPLGVDDIPFSISDSAGYANSLYFAAGASDFIVVSSSIVQTALNAGTWTTNVNSNISGAYKLNDFAAALNGAAPVLSSAGTIPIVNRATIGGLANNTPNIWNGTIKNITYYPRRLSNTELQVITA